MTATLKTYGILALTMASLVLTGCGGGGGGGKSNNSSGGGGNVTLTQNHYLPLISGTGWQYEATGESSVLNAVVASGSGFGGSSGSVFKFNVTSASSETGLVENFFSSSPSEVGFWGIQGNIELELDAGKVTITSIEFDQAIPYWRDSFTNGSGTFQVPAFTATIKARALGINFTETVQVTNAAVTQRGAQVVNTGFGPLSVQSISVGFSGNIEINNAFLNESIEVIFIDEVSFAKGVGIAKRETSFSASGLGGLGFTSELQGMVGLPEPRIFQVVQGQAVLVGTDDTVKIDGGSTLSSNSFTLVTPTNPGWVAVEAAAGNVFTVKATGAALPTAPRGEVFYFKGSSGLPLPLGISLLSE